MCAACQRRLPGGLSKALVSPALSKGRATTSGFQQVLSQTWRRASAPELFSQMSQLVQKKSISPPNLASIPQLGMIQVKGKYLQL